MNKKVVYLVLGLMGLILTLGISIQIKTVKSYGTIVGQTSEQSELKDNILKTKEKYDNLYKELEEVEAKLEIERTNATSNNSELTKLQDEIKETKILLGLTEVKGKGIKLVLQDSNIPTASYIGDINDLVVHDGDIIHVINALFNAGAEAVSVNEQRILSTTAIECDGSVIKINGEKVGAPFEIKAIGYPESLANISIPGGYLEKLQNRGIIVTLTKESEVKIPKYTGTLKFNYVNKTLKAEEK